MRSTSRRAAPRKTWLARPLACLAVCAAAALLVFLLPLHVPVDFQPAASASFVAGFNNRVAAIAAAAVGGCVLLWAWFSALGSTPEEAPPDTLNQHIGARLAGAVILATCIFFAVAGWMVAHSHLRYLADAGYFLEQMSSHAEYGGALYTQLEFAYGPLLFYPTVWLHAALRCGWVPAYFLTLALDQSLGLLLLVFVLNELPIRGRDRRFGFVLLAIGALNPILGLNYTFFRFITAFAVLLIATRTRSLWRTMTLLVAGDVLLLAISPEQGFAFLVAIIVFAGLQAWRSGAKWLLIAAAPVLGAGVFLLLVGRAYLSMLHSFSKGALSMPVAPYPHLLVFLLAVVWLVPCALGRALGSEEPMSIRLASCYALGVGLLPAALGRCDPLHVFFNGAGLLVLSLVAIRSRPMVMRVAWIAALVILVGWQQWINNRLLFNRSVDTIRLALMPRVPAGPRESLLAILHPALANRLRPTPDDVEYQLDVQGLEHEVGNDLVATPLEITPAVEEALKRSHHYRSDYYAFGVDVFSQPSEARKIHDLNQAKWALLPSDRPDAFIESPENLEVLQGFNFPYRKRNPVPFYPGTLLAANLDQQWTEVRDFGPYTLYRRRIAASDAR